MFSPSALTRLITQPQDPDRPASIRAHAVVIGLVVTATGISILLERYVVFKDAEMIFLLPVLIAALRWGLAPAITASLLGTQSYNYFFIPPRYTFIIEDSADFIDLMVFLVVALIISNLVAQVRKQTREQTERARVADALYSFSRAIASIAVLDELLDTVASHISALLGRGVVVLLPEAEQVRAKAHFPDDFTVADGDLAPASVIWRQQRRLPESTYFFPGNRLMFIPLQTRLGKVGVLGLENPSKGTLPPDARRLISALANQTAVAIQRIVISEEHTRIRDQALSERLKNAVLASISHDLRTPLVGIIGGLTTLQSLPPDHDPNAAAGLIAVALSDAERLHRFVENLLGLTKLESGGLHMKCEPNDVEEIISQALNRARPLLGQHRVTTEMPTELCTAPVDFVLLEQAMFNLIDNAAKYAPPGSAIAITCRAEHDTVIIEILDEGTGIPPHATEIIFNKFTRLQSGDQRPAGIGLGLVVCRGFIEAMGGTITAANRSDRSGARFTVTLPKSPTTTTLPDQ